MRKFIKLQIIVSVVSTITQQSLPPPATAMVHYKYTLCAILFRYTIANIRLLMCAALLLWFSHFLYLVGKKRFFVSIQLAIQPSEVNTFWPSSSSSSSSLLQNHQHEYYISTREMLYPFYSLSTSHGNVRVACALVYVYKSMFFCCPRISCIVSFRIVFSDFPVV